jgi:hypothetical protein
MSESESTAQSEHNGDSTKPREFIVPRRALPSRSEEYWGPMRDRLVELSQPSPDVMAIIPKPGFEFLFTVLVLVQIFGIAVCFVWNLGAGLVTIFLMFLLQTFLLLYVFRTFPRFTFNRKTRSITRRRIWVDRWATFDQVVAIQLCHGGMYAFPIHSHKPTDPIEAILFPYVKPVPYDTYQLNLVLDGPTGVVRDLMAHNADLHWLRAAGTQLADFLDKPFLDRAKRDDEDA